MNSVYKLLIQIVGQDKGASRELKQTKREVDALGKASSAMGGLMAGVGAAGIAYMGKQAIGAAVDLAKLGAEAERQEVALDELARQAGGTGDAIVAAVKRATDNTVAETDIILAANRGVLLGLGAQADQWEKLSEVARFRARAMGITTTQALNDITTAIGRESKMIADNLGIVWDMDSIMQDYAGTIGKTASELTQVERKQALLNDTIRIGQAQIQEAGGIMRDAADDIASLEVAITDLKVAWGKAIDEPVANSATEITKFLALISGEMPDRLADLALGSQGAGEGLLGLAEAAAALKGGEVISGPIQAALGPLGVLAEMLGADLNPEMKLTASELIAIGEASGASAGQIQTVADKLGIDLADGFAEAITSGQGFMVMLGSIPGYVAQANTSLGSLSGFLGTVNSAFKGMQSLPQEMLELAGPQAVEAWNILQREKSNAEQAWLENSIKMLHGFADANEDTAANVGRTWQDAYDDIRSAVESALQPTNVTALDMGLSELGLYVDKWDENARRLDAIAEGGFAALEAHPDWVEILKIPDEVLAGGEASLKAWATQTAGAVRDLTRPDLLNVDAAVAEVEAYFADMAARELSIDMITQAVIDKGIVSGPDAKEQVAQALGLDQSGIGETAGADIFQGMIDKFSEKSAAGEFATYLKTDVTNQAAQLKGAGYDLWITTEVGILDAMEEGNYVLKWVELLLPHLLVALGAQGQWSGEGEP